MKRMQIIVFLIPLLICGNTISQPKNPSHFYFVQISDTHFGTNFSVERAAKVVETINNLQYPIDFVVHTGDVFNYSTDESSAQSGMDVLRGLKMPIHFLAGNGDVNKENISLYKEKAGELNHAFEHKSYLLTFVSSIDSLNNNIDNVMDWLRETINKFHGSPILLFHHEPFLENRYDPVLLNRWREVFKQNRFTAVFSGHLHRDAFGWFEDVPDYVIPSVTEWRGHQASFRLYECKNGKISYISFYAGL